MSVKTTFLTQVDNFLNELCNVFPSNGEIKLFYEKYQLIRGANSSLVLTYFIQFVYPHKQKIMDKDENFFLEGGGQEELKDSSGLRFRDNLKNLWTNGMSDENKQIVWKYFKIFILLIEKYILENA